MNFGCILTIFFFSYVHLKQFFEHRYTRYFVFSEIKSGFIATFKYTLWIQVFSSSSVLCVYTVYWLSPVYIWLKGLLWLIVFACILFLLQVQSLTNNIQWIVESLRTSTVVELQVSFHFSYHSYEINPIQCILRFCHEVHFLYYLSNDWSKTPILKSKKIYFWLWSWWFVSASI